MEPSASHPVPDPLALGRRVRELRQRRGLKQAELAQGRLSTAYVSRIESGQRRPERDVVEYLAERLGTTADFLLTGIGRDEMADARLRLRYAELALHSGEAVDAVRELRSLLDETPDVLSTFRREAEVLLASALEASGALDEAIHVLERLRESDSAPNPLQLSINLSRLYRESGDFARGIDVAEAAVKLADELGLSGCDDAVRLTVTLAAAYFERGDTAHAYHLCQSAIERSEAMASPQARAAAYWNASIVASRRGQAVAGVGLAERALALLGESSGGRNLARLHAELGDMLLKVEPPDVATAERVVARARKALAGEAGTVVDVARCDATLAEARLHVGDLEEAERIAAEARAAVGDSAPLLTARLEMLLGRVSAGHHDPERAREFYRSAANTLSAHATDRGTADVWYELGALLDGAGEVEAARDAYRSAAASLGLSTVRPAQVPIRL
ncbi:MAG TPA: helix-turn-helix domain-containing protein [Mycobacteriales bacterium]|nr:helix-turn-helix domain-containing protein [Mycobacteriales bacterium]